MLPQWILRERGGLDKVSEISDCPGRPLRFQPWILHPLSITKLDKALSNLVLPQIRPCFEQEVELESSWGPFQPEQSCDPMILWKKTSKVNQRPRDEVSGEYVRLTCVTWASAEAGCFFGWWDHTYSITIQWHYSEEQMICFPPLSLFPISYSS